MYFVKKIGFFVLMILICILLVLGMFLFCSMMQSVLKPEETIFWVTGDGFRIIFLFEALVIFLVPKMLKCFGNNRNGTCCIATKIIFKKFWWLMLCVWIAFAYMMIMDTTYVTDQQILHRNFANPMGTIYMYEDVIGVDAGFYGKKKFLGASKGDFYYDIRLEDGTKINLNAQGGVCEEKIPNYITYQEIEWFDQKIMSLGVDKISSFDFVESNHLQQIYQDIFSKIINNKTSMSRKNV